MGYLRLLLALSVVLSHAGGIFKYTMASGSVAVETFFALSGFLMQLVLEKKYDPRRHRALFYSNRLLRIFPAYIAVMVFSLAAATALYPFGEGYFAFLSARSPDISAADITFIAITAVVIVGQEWLLFLHQGPGQLVLGTGPIDPTVWPLQIVPQAWSLSLELMFYALAPFLARAATWALATIAVTGLALKLTLVLSGLNHDPWLYRFFPTELPIFILGMMACRMRGRLCSAVPPLAVLAATLLVQPVAHVANKAGIAPEIIGQLYLAVAIIGLPSLFRLSQSSRFDAVAGELSYPVYLTHFLVIEMLRLKFPSGGLVANSLLSITAIAVTLPVSWLLIKAVERPVEAIRSRRRRFAAVEVAQPV